MCCHVLKPALATKMDKSSKTKSRTTQSALDRICSLLGAQREELLDLRAYAEGHPVPTLGNAAADLAA